MDYKQIKMAIDMKLPLTNEQRAEMLQYLSRQVGKLSKAQDAYLDLEFALVQDAKADAEKGKQIKSIAVGDKPQKVQYPYGYFGLYAPKTTVIFSENDGKETVLKQAIQDVANGKSIGEAFGKLTISPMSKSYPYASGDSGVPNALPEGLSRLTKDPNFKFVASK